MPKAIPVRSGGAVAIADADLDRPMKPGEIAKNFLDRQPSESTLWRWWTVGVAGVVLPFVYVAGRRRITPRQFRDWLRAVDAEKRKRLAERAGGGKPTTKQPKRKAKRPKRRA
jgi:hypothetical protein